MTRLLLIDADDGPDGGGVAALGRIARRCGLAYDFVAFEAIASGYTELEEGGRALLLDVDGLAARLAASGDDEIVVPCSRRALKILRTLAGQDRPMPADLLDLVMAPRFPDLGGEGLRALRDERQVEDEDEDDEWEDAEVGEGDDEGSEKDEARDLPFLSALHQSFVNAPDRARALIELGPGLLLSSSDRAQLVFDSEEAWYRLRALERSGDWPAAFFPFLGRSLHAATGFMADGELLAAAVLRVDGPRESWRPALGRSVAGRVWEQSLAGLAGAFRHSGFFESLWYFGPRSMKPELVAHRPLPAAWIDLAAEQVGAALEGRAGGLLPVGFFHADIPVDRALSPHELLRRSTGS